MSDLVQSPVIQTLDIALEDFTHPHDLHDDSINESQRDGKQAPNYSTRKTTMRTLSSGMDTLGPSSIKKELIESAHGTEEGNIRNEAQTNCQPLYFCDMCPNTVSVPTSCNVEVDLIRCDSCRETVKQVEDIAKQLDEASANNSQSGKVVEKRNSYGKKRKKKTAPPHKTRLQKAIKQEKYSDEEIKHECSECEKIFKSASVLRRHMASHAEDKLCNQCEICYKLCTSNSSLIAHQQTHRNSPSKKTSPGGEQVKKTSLSEIGDKHECGFCGKAFVRSSFLLKHSALCQSTSTQCTLCQETLPTSADLKLHMRIHFKCTECDKSFQQSSDLKRHLRTHTGEKRFQCDTCSSGFTSSTSLKIHLKMHREGHMYRCSVCKENFTGISVWKRHLQIHKGEKIYQCQVCNKSYSRAGHLSRHARLHTGEKPFSCDSCGDTFSCSQYLKRHSRIHTGEKPYPCNQCQRFFRDQSCLRRHKRTHSGERPYACKDCSKAFTSSANLKRHMRSHTGEKPYQCNVCGKSYKQRVVLQAHMMSHTGEKPHQCPVCSKGFIQQSNMKVHYQHHHTDVAVKTPRPLSVLPLNNDSSEKPSVPAADKVTIEVVRQDGNRELVTCNLRAAVREGQELKVVVTSDESHNNATVTSSSSIDIVASSMGHEKLKYLLTS